MKFILTLNDSDGVADSIVYAAHDQLTSVQHAMTSREFEAAREKRAELMFQALKKWTGDSSDTLRIEVDTDAGTARVLEAT